jgi:hypothetical protein
MLSLMDGVNIRVGEKKVYEPEEVTGETNGLENEVDAQK